MGIRAESLPDCDIWDRGFERDKGSLQSKGLSQAQGEGEQEQKGRKKKAKAIIPANLVELCGVQPSDTESVLEQAGRRAEPLHEGCSFRIFIQGHCSLFSCSSGSH